MLLKPHCGASGVPWTASRQILGALMPKVVLAPLDRWHTRGRDTRDSRYIRDAQHEQINEDNAQGEPHHTSGAAEKIAQPLLHKRKKIYCMHTVGCLMRYCSAGDRQALTNDACAGACAVRESAKPFPWRSVTQHMHRHMHHPLMHSQSLPLVVNQHLHACWLHVQVAKHSRERLLLSAPSCR